MKVLVETGYKYLGVLESDDVLHRECKERLRCEYVRRAKKCLKSKLNGGNMIKAINIWAVSLMRYSGESLTGRKKSWIMLTGRPGN